MNEGSSLVYDCDPEQFESITVCPHYSLSENEDDTDCEIYRDLIVMDSTSTDDGVQERWDWISPTSSSSYGSSLPHHEGIQTTQGKQTRQKKFVTENMVNHSQSYWNEFMTLTDKKIAVTILDWEKSSSQKLEKLGKHTIINTEEDVGPLDLIFTSDAVYDAELSGHLVKTVRKLLETSIEARKEDNRKRNAIFKDKESYDNPLNFPFMVMTLTKRSDETLISFIRECHSQQLNIIRLFIHSNDFECNSHIKDPNTIKDSDVRIYLVRVAMSDELP